MTVLPQRVRVVVLGSNLHGLGIAQDLLSRGWHDVVVLDDSPANSTVQQSELESYDLESLFSLFNFRDFRQIPKALEELAHLARVAEEGIYQLPFYMSLAGQSALDALFYRCGVWWFRRLTKKAGIQGISHSSCERPELKSALYFPDVLVSTRHIRQDIFTRLQDAGFRIVNAIRSLTIAPSPDGWELKFKLGETDKKISALYVVNALGVKGNRFLADNRLPITWPAINLDRRIEYYRDLSQTPLDQAWILPRHEARQAMRLIPMPNRLVIMIIEHKRWGIWPERDQEVPSDKLLASFRNAGIITPAHKLQYIRQEKSIYSVIYESQRQLGSLRNSSPFISSEHRSGRGLLLTLYNMKTMTYRAFCEEIGDRIIRHFGESRSSRTLPAGNS